LFELSAMSNTYAFGPEKFLYTVCWWTRFLFNLFEAFEVARYLYLASWNPKTDTLLSVNLKNAPYVIFLRWWFSPARLVLNKPPVFAHTKGQTIILLLGVKCIFPTFNVLRLEIIKSETVLFCGGIFKLLGLWSLLLIQKYSANYCISDVGPIKWTAA